MILVAHWSGPDRDFQIGLTGPDQAGLENQRAHVLAGPDWVFRLGPVRPILKSGSFARWSGPDRIFRTCLTGPG